MTISIHALLAESDRPTANNATTNYEFLSTLSLRRATDISRGLLAEGIISIHALLAESDYMDSVPPASRKTFLSTLSLRRATNGW